MMTGKHAQLAVALSLVVIGAGARLLPHPANFAPIGAVAIFGGAVLPRKLGLWVPLAALMISDLVLGFYIVMPVVWACYGVVALASSYWLRRPGFWRTAGLVLSASLFFFATTNFAVWVASGMYTHSWAGFVQCYVMALPFFRATLMSDLYYTVLFFGAYGLVGSMVRHWQRVATAEANA